MMCSFFVLLDFFYKNKWNYLPAVSSLQAHPWFEGIDWEKIYQMEAAFIPEVNDELDTQNFEKFEEVLVFLDLFLISWSYLHVWSVSLLAVNIFFCLFFFSQITRVRLHPKLVHGGR